jgi:uridine kinase
MTVPSTSRRADVLSELADWLAALDLGHPVRVGVDGITAAGKSTFAAELADAIVGRTGVHLSTDDYHHQRARRRRQGPLSGDGYYEDAYDLAAFRDRVLVPLGPGGDRRYQARHHDLDTDEVLDEEPVTANSDDVIVVDGSFLQRPELAGHWDAVVWLDTSFATALERALGRDQQLFGNSAKVREAYELRYHAACRRYLREVRPVESATVVVANDDLDRPALRWPSR